MYDIQHALNVSQLSVEIGKSIGMGKKDLTLLYSAGLFHDIGKMVMPRGILEKPATLSQDEYGIIQWHVTLGHKILSQMPDEIHLTAANVALYHHERLDGSGYLGLQGEQITLLTRIIMVADVYDALSSARPYREKWSEGAAIAYLQNNSGTLFDTEVVDTLTSIYVLNS
jgi:putative nucleotidyltransferase with HDIG domain